MKSNTPKTTHIAKHSSPAKPSGKSSNPSWEMSANEALKVNYLTKVTYAA